MQILNYCTKIQCQVFLKVSIFMLDLLYVSEGILYYLFHYSYLTTAGALKIMRLNVKYMMNLQNLMQCFK